MVKCSVRYMVCFSVWISLVSFYVLRSNISIAILSMTTDIYASSNGNGTNNTKNATNPQFNWSDSLRGQILAGFFYGYASTHFIGAVASAKIGPRLMLSICLIGSSIATFLTPYLTHLSPYSLIAARILVGIFSGSLYPIMQEILGVWTPQTERTILTALTHSGNIFGIVLTCVSGSFFCGSRFGEKGWEYFFYFSGCLSTLAFLLWLGCGFDSPYKHPYITRAEINYIKGNFSDPSNNNNIDSYSHKISLKSIPFKQIFTSIPVWTVTAAHAAYLFIFYAMVTGQSKFLSDAYDLSIPKASLYSAIPFVSNFLVQLLIPPIVDYLRNKRGFNITLIRRFVSGIGFSIGCALFASVGFFNVNQLVAVIVVMSFALGVIGLNNSGYLTASIDIAPAYAGIIMGIMNTFGSVAGFLNATMAGLLVEKYKNDKLLGWRFTFIITSAVSFVLGTIFVLFGVSVPQPWSKSHPNSRDSIRGTTLLKTATDHVDI